MGKPVYIVVTPFFPSPHDWSGAYCYDFVQALLRNGKYDVRVFVPGAGGGYDYHGVHVTTFRMRILPSVIFPFLFSRFNQGSFLAAVRSTGIKLEDVAICHGHTAIYGIYPLAIKQANPNCLTLLHHHDCESFGLNLGRLRYFWLYKAIQFPLFRRMHEKIDCHVFISNVSRQSFEAVPDASWTIYKGYKRQMRGLSFMRSARIRESFILHNGVDIEIFNRSQEKSNPRQPTILCIANFIDWKSQITLLQALVRIRERMDAVPSLRLIGTGPLLGKCKKFVEKNGLQSSVTFESEVHHEQLPDIYRSASLFVLPSYFEGFGCVFTEAYACGVPFITCEGQGMDEFIPDDERHLWLCRPLDDADLAEKILYFFRYRPEQHLKDEIAIQPLVDRFVEQIDVSRDRMLEHNNSEEK